MPAKLLNTLPSSQSERRLLARGARLAFWAPPSEVGLKIASRGQRVVGLVAWQEARVLFGRSRDVFRTLGESGGHHKRSPDGLPEDQVGYVQLSLRCHHPVLRTHSAEPQPRSISGCFETGSQSVFQWSLKFTVILQSQR